MTNEERIVEIAKTISDQAFPIALDASTLSVVKGLSKREYFAAKALQGLSVHQHLLETEINLIAAIAVRYADALCMALNQKPSQV